MAKITTAKEVASEFHDNMKVMIGGFLGVGTPESLVQELVAKDSRNLTVIANDNAFPGVGVGRLQDSGQMVKIHTSYIGGHPATGEGMEKGTMEVVLTPQGTLAEQIRAGGSGLGGFLTPTGVGTVVAKGKETVEVDGKKYLMERPLTADVALIKAWRADESGNLIYRLSARNFNPLMAMAAKVVIAEVEEIVPVGTLDPDHVVTPGIFVDYLVKGGN